MESLTLWVVELCVCSLAVVIAEGLLPEGNVKKTVYFVLGLIVVTCFAAPIRNFEMPNLDMPAQDESFRENTDWLNQTTQEVFEKNVTLLVEDCLENMKVESKKIELYTDINEDNCIFIDKVRITVSKEYSSRLDEISNGIYQTLGLDTDVIVR